MQYSIFPAIQYLFAAAGALATQPVNFQEYSNVMMSLSSFREIVKAQSLSKPLEGYIKKWKNVKLQGSHRKPP